MPAEILKCDLVQTRRPLIHGIAQVKIAWLPAVMPPNWHTRIPAPNLKLGTNPLFGNAVFGPGTPANNAERRNE
jgi:hypothetical protein